MIEPPADVLDPSTRRQIRGALEHLGRRDLYDALGLFRDAPASIIAARADEERQRWMRKAQVTAEKTAWLEIIAHAQSHLTSPKARARYDRTLLLEAEERFDAVTALCPPGTDAARPGNARGARSRKRPRWGSAPSGPTGCSHRACRKLGVPRRRWLGGSPARARPAAGSAGSQRRLPAASVSQLLRA